jgi:RHS repeat-associated protein
MKQPRHSSRNSSMKTSALRHEIGRRPLRPVVRWLSMSAIVMLVVLRPSEAAQPWEEWIDDPLFATVAFESRARAATNSTFTISIGDSELIWTGEGCSTAVTNFGFAELKFYHPYRLTVVGTNLNYIELEATAGAGVSLLDPRKPQTNVPKGVKILIDDYNDNWLSDANGTCGYLSNSWKFEVRRDVRPRWRIDDDSNDPDTAPGDGTWARLGPGRSMFTNRAAIDWSVSLGHLLDNNAAGKLRLQEPGLFAATYTPSNLFYTCKGTNVRSQVELVVTNLASGVLRQVKAPQAFVDILPGTNQYSLRFHLPADVGPQTNAFGLYTNITGNPFVVWRIVNPDANPAVSNRLHIIEERNGTARTNRIEFDSGTGTWALRQGAGAEERVETRLVTFSYNGSTGRTNRAETVEVKYAAGLSAYNAKEEYELFPWGWEICKTTVDPSGSTLVTEFAYYDDPISDLAHEYRRLKWIKHPDGRWEKRSYGDWYYDPYFWAGKSEGVLRPWKDEPATPDDATDDNAHRTAYQFYYSMNPRVPISNNQYLHKPGTYTDYWIREELFWESWHGAYYDPRMLERYQALDINEDITVSVGTTQRFFPPTAPRGLADHLILFHKAGQPARFHYYDHGTYNPTNYTFTYDSTNHLYTLEESLPVGPDRRETVLHGNIDFVDGGIELVTIEDHLYDPGDNYWTFYFYPLQSWKETTVYSKGVPVLQEKHVCSGTNVLGEPIFELLHKLVLQNDTLGRVTNVVRIDAASGSSRTLYSADYRGTNTFDGDLKLSETDESGVQTLFTYDSLKRPKTITRKGISAGGGYPAQSDIVTTLTHDAQHRRLSEIRSAGGLSLTNSVTYDVAGRPLTQTDPAGLVTSFSYSVGGRITTTTHPGGATEIVESYLDGRPKSRTGTAVVAEYYDHDLDWDNELARVRKLTQVNLASPSSPRWQRTGTDWVDNTVYAAMPAFSLINWSTNYLMFANGYQLSKATTNNVGRGLFAYDGLGRLWRQALRGFNPADGSWGSGPWPDPASQDRIQQRDVYFRKIGSTWYHATTNLTYLTDNSATPTVLGVSLEHLNNLSVSEVSKTTYYDHFTNATVATVTVNRSLKRVTETVNPPQSALNAIRVSVNGLLQTERTPTVGVNTWHYYDALGRETAIVNPQGASSTTAYHPATGQVIGTTDFTGQPTWYEYYSNAHTNAGRLKTLTAANGKRTFYEYTLRGELWRTWGEVPYPEERIYNEYGELVELRTYRGGVNWAAASWPGGSETPDKTYWQYQASTGLLTNKLDHVNKGAKFTYYDNGLLHTRQWHRGVTLTNLYDKFGDLTRITYSDSTPQVRYTNSTFQTYSRAGLPRYIIDATGERQMYYDPINRVTGERWVGGLFVNLTLTNRFDTLYGREWLKLQKSGADQFTHTYGYDAYGRINSVADGVYSAGYGYLANSDLLQTTTFRNNGATRLTTSRVWEYGVRLHSIANVTTFTPSRHTYAYDALNRRVGATLADGSRWAYDYNDRNELVSASRLWADHAPVSGQQFQYAFDNIGNLKTNWSGGDVNGMNLRSSAFTVNSLNQYSSITVPGYRPVTGVAHAAATVTVNSQSTDRKGEHYHRELSISNGSGPVWTNITVTSTTNVTGNLLVPPATRSLTYDDDGNLTADGLWTYQWDGENRLKQVESAGTVPEAARRRLVLTYDHMGRRSTKKVYAWSGGGYSASPSVDLRFVYDAWNLVAELNAANNNPIRSYVWGLDLSGSLQGAGGIGGLLVVRDHGAGTYHFAGYDGNGNVTVLVNAADQSLSAQYEYSPFGDLLRATGPLARSNPFRFSTKFLDEETDLVYYGYRYYSPALMRWITRDPIEEGGGANLFAAMRNDPLRFFDPIGADPLDNLLLAGLVAELTRQPIEVLATARKLTSGYNRLAQIAKWSRSTLFDVQYGTPFFRRGVGSFLTGVTLGAKAKLTAVELIGTGASNLIHGTYAEKGTKESNAEDFVRNTLSGDLAYADLDAAVLAAQIGAEAALSAGGILGLLTTGTPAFYHPAYSGLAAWETLQSFEDVVGGAQ